ncbi:MAG TPA: hypothetical protein VK708_10070 [Bryobacteraceae bacterium]|jgi:hypothetical protein|nr:hypothetical protein [Bryobacteraceae bacterium]
MKRLTMPKLAVILAALVSFAWIVLFYATPWSPAQGPRAAIILAIPVAISLGGLSAEKRRKVAGVALLLFSLVVILVSFWIIAVSYLPSAILFLASRKGQGSRPDPFPVPKIAEQPPH